MLTREEWKARETELKTLKAKRQELKAQTKELSRQISVLQSSLGNRKNYHSNTTHTPYNHRDTIAYQMFGKRYRDLNTAELRQYNAIRQQTIRTQRKENERGE